MLLNYELIILLSITAIVVNILLEPDMLLYWYGNLLDRLPTWLSFPLGRCEKCLSGQLALWGFILLEPYNLVNHIFTITATIFITYILTLILWKLRK